MTVVAKVTGVVQVTMVAMVAMVTMVTVVIGVGKLTLTGVAKGTRVVKMTGS